MPTGSGGSLQGSSQAALVAKPSSWKGYRQKESRARSNRQEYVCKRFFAVVSMCPYLVAAGDAGHLVAGPHTEDGAHLGAAGGGGRRQAAGWSGAGGQPVAFFLNLAASLAMHGTVPTAAAAGGGAAAERPEQAKTMERQRSPAPEPGESAPANPYSNPAQAGGANPRPTAPVTFHASV